MFFCNFCEIFKNTFLTEPLRPTAAYFFKLQANLGDTCRRKVKLDFPSYCKQTNLKDVYSWNKIRSLKGYVKAQEQNQSTCSTIQAIVRLYSVLFLLIEEWIAQKVHTYVLWDSKPVFDISLSLTFLSTSRHLFL